MQLMELATNGPSAPPPLLAKPADNEDATSFLPPPSSSAATTAAAVRPAVAPKPRQRNRRKNNSDPNDAEDDSSKRRCVSTACIACRKRKSKCDGNTPACAACSQVYGTECIYDPNSDLRRKGVYKNDIDNLKTQESTLQTLIQAILNSAEEDVPALVREIRTCESLDVVAERIVAKENGNDPDDEDSEEQSANDYLGAQGPTFETQLYGKMGDLRLDDGSVRYIGGTSNLIHLAQDESLTHTPDEFLPPVARDPITSWSTVTDDADLVTHLLNMYFTWHYTYFTTLSKKLFYEDFYRGKQPANIRRKHVYCTPLLVNAILALGCHFTSHSGAREDPDDSATAGDHFFREAKRLIMENDEHEKPALPTVQALALMSVREAGCGREAKGWVYSGMSFRMACDMGLNLNSSQLTSNRFVSGDELEEDARRITFWGCFLFDKCWSNYLGRLPQLPSSVATVSLFDVFPEEDSAQWSPYTDSGFTQAHAQPARTRAVARQIIKLCEISDDLMKYFYNPIDMEKSKGKAAELRKLSDIHTRLEAWRRELPKELEPREGGLSSVLVMHMFFQLLFIHLFRPFLKYNQATSPLPATVSPRKLCTQAAAMISKLMRLYKRSHGLRQICNIAVYIAHSACTIHLLNLPDKNARRDIVHGVKHLEEIAEGWLCARRTLGILSWLATKWQVDLPDEAAVVLARTDAKFGPFQGDAKSPGASHRHTASEASAAAIAPPASQWQMPPPNALPAATGNTAYLANGNSNGMANPTPVSSASIAPTTGYAVQRPSLLSGMPPPPPYARPQPQSGTSGNTNTSPNNGSQRGQSYQSEAPTTTTTSGNSPSDMFGGVEQLIREGQNWTYRDQAQLATGFENWGAGLEFDPGLWGGDATALGGPVGGISSRAPSVSGVTGAGFGASVATTGTVDSAAMNGGAAAPTTVAMTGMDGNGAASAVDTATMADWLSSMTYSNIRATMYNEDEWYQ